MKIIEGQELLKGEKIFQDPVALSIGVFDGVHLGHQALIREVCSQRNLSPWVITFHPNPALILRPKKHLGYLLTKNQKIQLLAEYSLHATVIIDFSIEFGKLRGLEFLSRIQEAIDIKFIVVGENFHFGNNMDTSAWKLKKLLEPRGINVQIYPAVRRGGEVVSSTRIRNAIWEGNLQAATELLGHPYVVDLTNLPIESEEGVSILSRRAVSQVLPHRGCFKVQFQDQETIVNGILEITDQSLRWQSNGTIDAISFW